MPKNINYFQTSTVADDDNSDIEQKLDKLENDLMEAIAAKTSGQNIIENYRHVTADLNTWFDGLIKKIDAVDVGSGLNCAQKLDAIAKIQNECEIQGQQNVNDFKQKAHQAIDLISNLDAQQVEDQIKSSDRRYNDIVKRVARKAQMIGSTSKGVEAIRNEINQVDNWLKLQIKNLQQPQSIEFDSSQLNARLQKLKAMTKDAEAKQTLIDSLEKRVANMQNDLEPLEVTQLESQLRDVAAKQNQLTDLLKSATGSVNEAVQGLKSFESDLDKVKTWIKTKLSDVRKQSSTMPLSSKAVENEIQTAKNVEVEIKKFGDESLNDIVKQGQNIFKKCSDSDKGALEKILNEITQEFNDLKDEAANRTKHLANAFDVRKTLETELSKLDDWLNEVEISTSAEIQIKSLPLLEEQLRKFESLNKDKEAMKPLLLNLSEYSKSIAPTLNSADRLKLNEQLKAVKDKFNKPTINDRIRVIEEHIKRYKASKDKLNECIDALNRIKEEIRNVNKPIGSKVDDVKTLIITYERILRDLRQNRNKVNEIQIDDLPELQNVNAQHDEIINSVEKQIVNLRQAQTLREQYYTLIEQITSHISKFKLNILEIEKSCDAIEEKIKQYDELTTRIQECEGLLASTNDKGQKIASEGTVADGNLITEQMQSLKQQLQNLRKQIETQRHQDEITLAEHNKVANDLSALLLWLHNNEVACKSRPLLERDPESVDREIAKHNKFTDDVHKHLDAIHEIDEQIDVDSGVPSSVIDMLSEGRSLRTNLPKELADREKYLTDSKEHRNDYIKKVSNFKNWLNQAEACLEDSKHGIDFENLSTNIDNCNGFFENERPARELITIEIQHSVDNIWPTLQTFDQNELSEEVRQKKNQLESVLSAAKKHRAQLEQCMADWNEYKELLNVIKQILARVNVEETPTDSLAALRTNLQKSTGALRDLKVSQCCFLFRHRTFCLLATLHTMNYLI